MHTLVIAVLEILFDSEFVFRDIESLTRALCVASIAVIIVRIRRQ